MQLGSALVADAQAFELMQPGQCAFHHPAGDAQAAAVRDTPPSQQGLDVALAQFATVGIRIISAVCLDPLGALARPAAFAPNGPPQPRTGAPAGCNEHRPNRYNC